MKKRKEIKPIKDSTINKALGVLLILFALVLILDVGYLARTINFVLFFSFGYLAELFYLAMIISGAIYIFVGKKFKFAHKGFLYTGLVIAAIGASIILTTSMSAPFKLDVFAQEYWQFFTPNKYYEFIRIPYLFRQENVGVGGGFIGHLLTACFNSLSIPMALSIVIGSLIIVGGVLLILTPNIKTLLLKRKNRSDKKLKKKKGSIITTDEEFRIKDDYAFLKEPLAEKEELTREPKANFIKQAKEKHEKFEQPQAKVRDEFYIIKDKSKEIIKNASKMDGSYINRRESIETAEMPTVSKVVEEKAADKPEKHITFSESSYNRVGGLQPVRFIREGVSFESHPVNTSSDNPMDKTVSLNVSENQSEIQANNLSPIQDKKPEQIHFDFNEQPKDTNKPIQNKDLVAVQPEFSDPIIIKKEDAVLKNVDQAPQNEPNNVMPKMIKHKFIEPSLDLLNEYETGAANEKNEQTAEQRKDMINNIFETFNVHATCIGYVVGPSVTRYNIGYTETAQFKSVNNLTNDISIRLGGVDARFESIVPGETYSGLEISNAVVTMVGFKEVLQSLPGREKHPLAIAFGKNISGDVVWADLDKTPHMLISGTTGSGKSIFIHSIIMTLIMRNNPDDLRLVLVDPKRVEMSKYKGMPHLLCPNITEPEEAVVCLNKLVDEMEKRYSVLEENCVSDIGQYNELCQDKPELEKMPYYVAILDEYSDLVDRARDIERPVISLAQKARACGIHLIICTQRPSTNVITGLIKGNLPTHVALMTASTTDSITIIGEGGAEKLLGKGDMLVQSPIVSKTGCARLQGCFVQNKEILKVVEFLKSTMTTDYHPEFLDLSGTKDEAPASMPFEGHSDIHVKVDDAYEDVKDMVMNEDFASISKIQREFGFGFTRAGRIFNQLVKDGIVENPKNKKGNSTGCKVLIHDPSYGREANIGSDELASTETMEEYIANAEKADGSY